MRTILAAIVLAVATAASAQSYPDRPIRLVIPWPAGDPPDVVGRAVGERLPDLLGQPVVIENQPGANGEIGTAAVARAAPDGYTLLLSTGSSLAMGPALKRVPYDPVADFVPITQLISGALVLLARPDLPIRTVPELVAYAKANPGKLTYGSGGTGGTTHLSGVLLEQLAGIELLHVPYKGAAPALSALLGGQVDLVFVNAVGAIPHMQAGKLRGIAVTKAQRMTALPDLPAIAETLPGYELTSWYGFMAPRATPDEVVERIYVETVKVLKMPEVESRLARGALQPEGTPPREHAAKVKAEVARWAALAKSSGIRID